MRHLVAVSLLFLLSVPAPAQQQRQILSPRDSVTLTLDTNVISVNYGRPSMRGRKIMGGLVPWGKVWRTGANEATTLRTNFDMTLGGVPVPRGAYTLWTLPSPDGWKFILNKQTGQWGTRYDEKQDLARFDATVEQSATPVDTFRISLEKTGSTSGRLVLAWENTRVWAPFEQNSRIRPLSPPDSAEIRIGGQPVKVVYSKPFIRGRRIWGVVIPFDSVWRTGANAPTLLTTGTSLTVGGHALPQGAYVLRSLPTENSLTLLISKRPAGPGPVPDSLLVARIAMKQSVPASTIDPFRIWFEPSGMDTATLHLGWADREYSVDLKK